MPHRSLTHLHTDPITVMAIGEMCGVNVSDECCQLGSNEVRCLIGQIRAHNWKAGACQRDQPGGEAIDLSRDAADSDSGTLVEFRSNEAGAPAIDLYGWNLPILHSTIFRRIHSVHIDRGLQNQPTICLRRSGAGQ
jgi:hypothetical protein